MDQGIVTVAEQQTHTSLSCASKLGSSFTEGSDGSMPVQASPAVQPRSSQPPSVMAAPQHTGAAKHRSTHGDWKVVADVANPYSQTDVTVQIETSQPQPNNCTADPNDCAKTNGSSSCPQFQYRYSFYCYEGPPPHRKGKLPPVPSLATSPGPKGQNSSASPLSETESKRSSRFIFVPEHGQSPPANCLYESGSQNLQISIPVSVLHPHSHHESPVFTHDKATQTSQTSYQEGNSLAELSKPLPERPLENLNEESRSKCTDFMFQEESEASDDWWSLGMPSMVPPDNTAGQCMSLSDPVSKSTQQAFHYIPQECASHGKLQAPDDKGSHVNNDQGFAADFPERAVTSIPSTPQPLETASTVAQPKCLPLPPTAASHALPNVCVYEEFGRMLELDEDHNTTEFLATPRQAVPVATSGLPDAGTPGCAEPSRQTTIRYIKVALDNSPPGSKAPSPENSQDCRRLIESFKGQSQEEKLRGQKLPPSPQTGENPSDQGISSIRQTQEKQSDQGISSSKETHEKPNNQGLPQSPPLQDTVDEEMPPLLPSKEKPRNQGISSSKHTQEKRSDEGIPPSPHEAESADEGMPPFSLSEKEIPSNPKIVLSAKEPMQVILGTVTMQSALALVDPKLVGCHVALEMISPSTELPVRRNIKGQRKRQSQESTATSQKGKKAQGGKGGVKVVGRPKVKKSKKKVQTKKGGLKQGVRSQEEGTTENLLESTSKENPKDCQQEELPLREDKAVEKMPCKTQEAVINEVQHLEKRESPVRRHIKGQRKRQSREETPMSDSLMDGSPATSQKGKKAQGGKGGVKVVGRPKVKKSQKKVQTKKGVLKQGVRSQEEGTTENLVESTSKENPKDCQQEELPLREDKAVEKMPCKTQEAVINEVQHLEKRESPHSHHTEEKHEQSKTEVEDQDICQPLTTVSYSTPVGLSQPHSVEGSHRSSAHLDDVLGWIPGHLAATQPSSEVKEATQQFVSIVPRLAIRMPHYSVPGLGYPSHPIQEETLPRQGTSATLVQSTSGIQHGQWPFLQTSGRPPRFDQSTGPRQPVPRPSLVMPNRFSQSSLGSSTSRPPANTPQPSSSPWATSARPHRFNYSTGPRQHLPPSGVPNSSGQYLSGGSRFNQSTGMRQPRPSAAVQNRMGQSSVNPRQNTPGYKAPVIRNRLGPPTCIGTPGFSPNVPMIIQPSYGPRLGVPFLPQTSRQIGRPGGPPPIPPMPFASDSSTMQHYNINAAGVPTQARLRLPIRNSGDGTMQYSRDCIGPRVPGHVPGRDPLNQGIVTVAEQQTHTSVSCASKLGSSFTDGRQNPQTRPQQALVPPGGSDGSMCVQASRAAQPSSSQPPAVMVAPQHTGASAEMEITLEKTADHGHVMTDLCPVSHPGKSVVLVDYTNSKKERERKEHQVFEGCSSAKKRGRLKKTESKSEPEGSSAKKRGRPKKESESEPEGSSAKKRGQPKKTESESEPEGSSAKKRGQPKKTESESEPEGSSAKKRGQPKKTESESEPEGSSAKKRGQPKKTESESEPEGSSAKKRGQPKKTESESEPEGSSAKKRGRPKKTESESEPEGSSAKKRGQPKKTESESEPEGSSAKKRGRPKKTESESEPEGSSAKKRGQPKKTESESEPEGSSAKKRGQPKKTESESEPEGSSAKKRGRPKKKESESEPEGSSAKKRGQPKKTESESEPEGSSAKKRGRRKKASESEPECLGVRRSARAPKSV